MTDEALRIARWLDELRQRWWLWSLLTRTGLAVAAGTLLLLIVLAVDQVLPYGPAVLWLLFVAWLVLATGPLAVALYRSLCERRSLEAAARRVEATFPEIDGELVGLLQLARADDAFSLTAVRALYRHVADQPLQQVTGQIPWRDRIRFGLATARDAAFSWLAASVCLLLLAVLCSASPGWSSSLTRIMVPWRFVPHEGTVKIVEVVPGDTVHLKGKPFQVRVRLAPVERTALPDGTLFLQLADGTKQQYALLAVGGQSPELLGTVPSLQQDARYYVQVHTTQSPRFRIRVTEPPEITGVEIEYRYPAYLGRPPERVRQSHGDLRAPQYTEALVRFHTTVPLRHGYLALNGNRVPGAVVGDARRALEARLWLVHDATYSVHVTNQADLANPSPRLHRIDVIEDRPPAVRLVRPVDGLELPEGGELELVVRARDDYGVTKLWCELKRAPVAGSAADDPPRTESAIVTLGRWHFDAQQKVTKTLRWRLPDRYTSGSELLVRAVTEDNRRVKLPGKEVKPQRSATAWIRVRVVSRQERSEQLARVVPDLKARLFAVLQTQLKARASAARARELAGSADYESVATTTAQLQHSVRVDTKTILDYLEKQERLAELAPLQRSLHTLHAGPMARAVRVAHGARTVRTPQARQTATGELMAIQDRIIAVLRELLQLARRAERQLLAEAERKQGGDLPTDPLEDKLRELRDKLNEFLRQQKKVIEASENLAKKPVEDFTEEDKKLLKELAAVEEDWARFMGETHSDLSRLPEQDFANPSLLEELVEIETELKMAADALTKKAVELAVPLEQLGAERAEEMTTNIEKWLPDTPDRERWMQEEPIDEMFKSAPMAELPGELDDLVGELMEEEEDLFEEMEDVSSSWADSLDKGAGWDTMDGPISNMSARGVTGNRLPNSNEIGGRSGEGRSGKSHGEFVSKEAVGKGGRKTPTRLTPDPYVEGQVEDKSKDPVGGATGGGKQSGVGGEGLEGPAPARPPEVLQRLAEKQAALRNKAEVICLQFQVTQFHRTDLEQLIELMAQVEADLRAGRVHAALRRREVVLKGLSELKAYAGGQLRVKSDRSGAAPAEVRKEMVNAFRKAAPPGWEDLTSRYFDKLTRSAQ